MSQTKAELIEPQGNVAFDTNTLYVDAGNNRVGIGITSPAQKLRVVGDSGTAQFGAGTAGNALFINAFDSDTIYMTASASNATQFGFGSASNIPLFFMTNNTERARIDTSGRLLVGTSTSIGGALLQVADAAGNCGRFYGSSSATNGAYLVFGRSQGTTGSPSVVASGDGLGAVFFDGYDGSAYRGAAAIRAEVDGTPGANDMPGRLVFSTTADGASSPTERMRISNDGTVLVNRTSNTSAASQIAVTYPGSTRFGLTLNDADSVNAAAIKFDRGGTQVGSITTNTGATSYNTSSDYRLKENIELMAGAVGRIQQIPVYRFNFIADPDKTVDGFLAHEVQPIVPEAITGEKDAVDDDGNPIYQGIDQSKLVPLLTAALQEAVAKIESLEARLTAAGI